MYFIGSRAKAAKWANPAQLHIPMSNPLAEVVVTSSNPPELNGGTSVCGRKMQQWNTQGDDMRGWLKIDLGETKKVFLEAYTMQCGRSFFPMSWWLQASVDGEDWFCLDERERFTGFNAKGEYITFAVPRTLHKALTEGTTS